MLLIFFLAISGVSILVIHVLELLHINNRIINNLGVFFAGLNFSMSLGLWELCRVFLRYKMKDQYSVYLTYLCDFFGYKFNIGLDLYLIYFIVIITLITFLVILWIEDKDQKSYTLKALSLSYCFNVFFIFLIACLYSLGYANVVWLRVLLIIVPVLVFPILVALKEQGRRLKN